MPTSTYVPLATYTVTGSPDNEVVFSSVPATYRDLILMVSAKSTENVLARDIIYRLNNDSGNNYSRVQMFGDSSGASSYAASSDPGIYAVTTANSSSGFGLSVLQFMDYAQTDKHKTVLVRANAPGAFYTSAVAFRWANTAAITSITMVPNLGASFAVGSTFSIFGIAG